MEQKEQAKGPARSACTPELWRGSDYYKVSDVSAVKSRIKELYQGDHQWSPADTAQWKDYCLYNAAGYGYLAVCEYLVLDEGADPTAKFYKGQTAVHNAARCGHVSVLHLFSGTHSSLTPTDDNGYTPLAWADRMGHKQCQQVLTNLIRQRSNERTAKHAEDQKIGGGPTFNGEGTYVVTEEQENTSHSSSEAALLLNCSTTGSATSHGRPVRTRALSRRENIEMELV